MISDLAERYETMMDNIVENFEFHVVTRTEHKVFRSVPQDHSTMVESVRTLMRSLFIPISYQYRPGFEFTATADSGGFEFVAGVTAEGNLYGKLRYIVEEYVYG